jgi:excisionase family DNA binding protein
MKPYSEREILTVDQTADMMQVSVTFIRRMIRAGGLRAVRFGKFWRIRRSEVIRVCSGRKAKG